MGSCSESHEDFSLGTLQKWVLEVQVWKQKDPLEATAINTAGDVGGQSQDSCAANV